MEWSRDKRICSFGAQCLYRPSSKIKMIETIKEDLLKYLKFDLKMSEGGPINHMNLWIGDFFKHYVSEGVWLGLFSVRNHFPEGKYLKYTLTNINDIILFDNGDNELSAGDRIVPVVYVNSAPTGTWEITIDSVNTAESPVGTVLKFWVNKPFVSWDEPDRYRVSFTPATVNQDLVADAMDRIAVVPNPYVASSNFETPPPQVFTYGRGERRVDFIHLPQVCTIRIYTLVGEHVETIEHAGTLYDGTESWNLLSKDGHDIAPGIYIYHVETPDGEEKLGRLAVIK